VTFKNVTTPCKQIEPTRSPSTAAHNGSGGVLVVVPGVADAKRARMVAKNMRHLRPRGCIVFTHLRCGDDAALDAALDVGPTPTVSQHCDVYRAANGERGGYVQHLKRVLPSFVEALGYEWVLTLLDDVDTTALSLPRLVAIAAHNELSWASPAVDGAHDDVCSQPPRLTHRTILPRPFSPASRFMITTIAALYVCACCRCSRHAHVHSSRGSELPPPQLDVSSTGSHSALLSRCSPVPSAHRPRGPVHTAGIVHRIEAFAWLMTPPMFRCLHALIDPALNGVGWGYDRASPARSEARTTLSSPKLAALSTALPPPCDTCLTAL
jgi:hypothetical protein